ncbi:hypothetical protein TELCIR_11630 [Teladorsagia circumcincta]|uniref:Uncharacterized protein n=1 Tax=Teladorsagia circumcincta TaxID=45464 RepID=A0A2G9UA90_TELCI|nr:hypothetical protein TELCIR_11630 [Teladorsagia circumcincta]
MLEGETIDASPDSPPETAPSAERWEALRIPVYQVRRPTGHVERKLPFSPSCAPEKPRALPSAPPLEHGTHLNEYARRQTPLTTSIPENPFEFVADDVRDRFPITPLFKGSTDWRLIAVDSVLSLLRRRQLNVVHAGLYHANALITAERLLLWEYDPSAELYPYDENNQLSKLLTAADGDAFYKNRKSSVVIVLKPAAEIATVVLLGEIRRCLLNTEGPTLSEEFGGGELLHFRTRNDDMWAELLYKKNLELSHVIHVMRQYHNLEKLCTFQFHISFFESRFCPNFLIHIFSVNR